MPTVSSPKPLGAFALCKLIRKASLENLGLLIMASQYPQTSTSENLKQKLARFHKTIELNLDTSELAAVFNPNKLSSVQLNDLGFPSKKLPFRRTFYEIPIYLLHRVDPESVVYYFTNIADAASTRSVAMQDLKQGIHIRTRMVDGHALGIIKQDRVLPRINDNQELR